MPDRSTEPGAEAPGPLIRIEGLTKRFGPVPAVDGISLEIRAGECLCLLGPSGCGKSTLLRLVSGLERPDTGRIELDGRDITSVPAHQRPINTMFQSYALFPHLTVAGNVAYGLRRAGLPRAEIAARVGEMLGLLRLEGLGSRTPAQISGGQRQRVALARALARRPRVLLLDEPLAALDRPLREATQVELKALGARLGTTMVVVTHDQDEAMVMADRIGVMEAGRLVQVGSAREIYERPRTRFVAGFVGDVNLIAGTVLSRDGDLWRIATAASTAPLSVAAEAGPDLRPGEPVSIAVRPERILFGAVETNALQGRLTEMRYRGAVTDCRVELLDGTLIRAIRARADPHGHLPLAPGEPVRLGFEPNAALVLAA